MGSLVAAPESGVPRRGPKRRAAAARFMLAAALVLGLAAFAAALAALDRAFPPLIDADLERSIEVLDRAGQPLRLYTTSDGFWRMPARIDAIDPQFVQLLVATEDQRFFRHPGVDPLALLRALGQFLATGRVVSGGSTLTMQTARLMEPRPRTLGSKWVEVLRALQIERRLDKAAILELYLTLAPYGGNLQGIEAASRFYFGKSPEYLTLDEVALLIALPQAPEGRRPDRNPQRALAARNRLLERWEVEGMLPAAVAVEARGRPVPLVRVETPRLAPHFSDRMRGTAGPEARVHTTLDARLQQRLEAVLQRLQSQLPAAHTAAALVVAHGSGEVRAWAGSGDYFGAGFPGQVDMVSAVRSPGSLLKPFIYTLAFDRGIAHPETLIADRADALQAWRPANFDHRFEGEMTLAQALARSRNVPAVQVLERVGVDAFLELLAGAEVHGRLPAGAAPGLAVGLGGMGISMLDVATLYGAIGTGGAAYRPSGLVQPGKPLLEPVMTQASAWYVARSLLQTPRPAARWPDQRPIAFKTGTSFAYRDAWAAGVDATHTVVVWVGRPDGGHTPGFTGLDQAVPLLLDLFAILPMANESWPGSAPVGALRVANEHLPEAWRRFDAEPFANHAELRVNSRPRITFPPEGGTLDWDPSEPAFTLEAQGGEAPYTWLVNGRPEATGLRERRYRWTVPDAGDYRITLIDVTGRSTSVHVTVNVRNAEAG